MVLSNIDLLLRATGAVDNDARTREVHDVLNRLVREYVAEGMLASISPTGWRYEHVVAMMGFTDFAVSLDEELLNPNAQALLSHVVYHCIYLLALHPLCKAF